MTGRTRRRHGGRAIAAAAAAALLAVLAAPAAAGERTYDGPDLGRIRGPAPISFCATEAAAVEVLRRATERLEAALDTGKPLDIERFLDLEMPLGEVEKCYTVSDAVYLPMAIITEDGRDVEGRWWRFLDESGEAIPLSRTDRDRVRQRARSIQLLTLNVIKGLYERNGGYYNIYIIGTRSRASEVLALPERL